MRRLRATRRPRPARCPARPKERFPCKQCSAAPASCSLPTRGHAAPTSHPHPSHRPLLANPTHTIHPRPNARRLNPRPNHDTSASANPRITTHQPLPVPNKAPPCRDQTYPAQANIPADPCRPKARKDRSDTRHALRANVSCADDVVDQVRKQRAEPSPRVKAPSSLPGAFQLPERVTRHARSRRRL